MKRIPNHIAPVWIKYTAIGSNREGTKEMVITRTLPEKDYIREIEKIRRELELAGFPKMIYSNRKISKNHDTGFNKISVGDSTLTELLVLFYYLEERRGILLPNTITRTCPVAKLNETIIEGIDFIKRNPRWRFKTYSIKESFGNQRIEKILLRHFLGNK